MRRDIGGVDVEDVAARLHMRRTRMATRLSGAFAFSRNRR
jgi:hypothetical protein